MNYELKYTGAWNAAEFFRRLSIANRLARRENFAFCEVSGLKGFSDLLTEAQDSPNIIAVDDTSDGFAQILNTPSRKMVKTVYLAMKHKPLEMELRAQCLEIMRELFRQFMSIMIQQHTQLRLQNIGIDPRVTFSEIDQFFAPGYACAFFAIAVDIPVDMRYRPDEWQFQYQPADSSQPAGTAGKSVPSLQGSVPSRTQGSDKS